MEPRKYHFYHQNKGDRIWWVDYPEIGDGEFLFSFDKHRIFNFFAEYPQELTPEQKSLFDKENPMLAKLKNGES